jgi:hypothetical protein
MADEPRKKKPGGPRLFASGRTEEQRAAGARLLEQLLTLYSTARITAKDLCLLCKICADAGVEGGAFTHYAYTGDQHQRHLNALLPWDGGMMTIAVPANLNKSQHRSEMEVYLRVLWGSIDKEVAGNKLIDEMLDSNPKTEDSVFWTFPHIPVIQSCWTAKRKAIDYPYLWRFI